MRPEADTRGDIVDLSGEKLGEHRGLIHYTVGQRRGLEIGGSPEPLYVVRLEPDTKRVVVGPRVALAVEAARLTAMNVLGPLDGPLFAKVRSMAKPVPARMVGDRLVFEAPNMACRRARRRYSMTVTGCWAAAGSPRPRRHASRPEALIGA